MSIDPPSWDADSVRSMIEMGAHVNVGALSEIARDIAVDDDGLFIVLDHFITHWMTSTLRATILNETGDCVPWSPEYEALMGEAHNGAVSCCVSILKRWPGEPFGSLTDPLIDVEHAVLARFGIRQFGVTSDG